MWTTLSASRWICLLTLAVVMLFSASEVDSVKMRISCCIGSRQKEINDIKVCYEQKPRDGCNHAFVILTKSGKTICVHPTPPWLKNRINTGEIKCGPEFSKKRRFEVLDEDDVE